MTLEQLKSVLEKHFGMPFLPEGLVKTRWVEASKGRMLEIVIGRRDVWLDESGHVTGAGTNLCVPLKGE